MRGHSEESVRKLCEEMERTLRRSDARASLPTTRSRTRGRPAADEEMTISSISSSTSHPQLIRFDDHHDEEDDSFGDWDDFGVLEKLF